MTRWQRVLLVCLLPLLCAFDPFRGKSSHVEKGNAKLAAGKIKEALEDYQRAARELPDEPGVQYNLGIAHYKLGQLDKARQALQRATAAGEPDLRAKAFYNLGNVQLDQKHYKEAVDAYRRSLQLRPGHRPSQWNLELALRRLREEEKKKQQQQKNDKKDQKNDPKKDKQDKKDKKDKKDQNQNNQKQNQNQNQDQKKKQQSKQDKKKPEPRDQRQQPPEMNQTLDALDRNDKNLQRRRARMQMGNELSHPAKDW